MKHRNRCAIILFVVGFACLGAAQTAKITVNVDKTGPAVSSRLYGIFFEEINHAGDGGLYAELVRNRGFEDANLPPACRRQGDFIVPPRTPHFWNQPEISDWQMPWKVEGLWPGWDMQVTGGGDADFQIVEDHPLNTATPHSLQIIVRSVSSSGRVAVVNGGYWGMAIRSGENYKLSLFVRSIGTPFPIVTTP